MICWVLFAWNLRNRLVTIYHVPPDLSLEYEVSQWAQEENATVLRKASLADIAPPLQNGVSIQVLLRHQDKLCCKRFLLVSVIQSRPERNPIPHSPHSFGRVVTADVLSSKTKYVCPNIKCASARIQISFDLYSLHSSAWFGQPVFRLAQVR
jgi:hypothetical protein